MAHSHPVHLRRSKGPADVRQVSTALSRPFDGRSVYRGAAGQLTSAPHDTRTLAEMLRMALDVDQYWARPAKPRRRPPLDLEFGGFLEPVAHWIIAEALCSRGFQHDAMASLRKN
jgi:hypothetical protein